MSRAASIFDVEEPDHHQVEQDDLLVTLDPSARFADPSARKAAFDEWVSASRPWPPTPAGMLSAICGATLGSGRRR